MCGGWFPAVTVTQPPDEPRCRLPGTTSQKPREWCNGKLWYSNINRFCNSTVFRNFVKNSFKSDVALKHAQGERPERKAYQKSRNRRPRRSNARDDQKDVYSVCRTRYCAHPREIDTTIVAETSVPDACLNILAVSCVVTSASAGSRGQFSLKMTNTVNFMVFFLVVDWYARELPFDIYIYLIWLCRFYQILQYYGSTFPCFLPPF